MNALERAARDASAKVAALGRDITAHYDSYGWVDEHDLMAYWNAVDHAEMAWEAYDQFLDDQYPCEAV